MPSRSNFSLRPNWAFVALIGIALLPAVSHAQGFPPISPEDLKMTSEPKVPGAPAIILFREVDRDDNGYTSHEDNYVRIKILTEEGRSYANVEVEFDKADENVVSVHARTLKADGSVIDFDGKVFERTIEKSQGVKYLAKTFTLPNVQVGDIVEYRYTFDFSEKYIYGSLWVLSQPLFTRYARFSLKPYQSRNGDMSLRWTWHALPSGATPKQGPDHIVRMEAHDIPAFEEEDHMPPASELKARVNFIYDDEYYMDREPDRFWRHVNKNRYDRLESFVGKRKAMEEAVAQIVSPADPPEVKLRKIYDRVQQIRNTSYEVQKSIQEEKRDKEKPVENVEELWKRGYGNGQQLTWLYLALVRAAGFDAYGVWAAGRSQYFFTPTTMENRKLDANVVLVKLNGKDLYFDPGAAFTPYGMLTWPETGTPGLCLTKDGGTWVKTTLPQSSESRIDLVAKLRLTDSGSLEGKLKVTYSGLEGMYHRLDVRNSDEVARKKFLEERVKSLLPVTAEVDLTNKPEWASSETPLVAEFDISVPGWASNAGKRALIPAALFTAIEKHTFEHTKRVQPIYVHYPYQKSEDVTIELPQGWQVASIPTPQNHDAHVLSYTLKVDKDGATLHTTRTLAWDLLALDPKYYPALRSFFQSVRTGDDQQIVLQPAAASAGN